MMPLLGSILAYEGERQVAPLIAAPIVVPRGWRLGGFCEPCRRGAHRIPDSRRLSARNKGGVARFGD
jgi:hypothetical protein